MQILIPEQSEVAIRRRPNRRRFKTLSHRRRRRPFLKSRSRQQPRSRIHQIRRLSHIPVNPNETKVFDEKSYADLEDAAAAIAPNKIEIVDIFRRPENIPPVVDSAIAIGAKVIWIQLGLEHNQAAKKAQTAGLTVIMDACLKIEHTRRRALL